MTLTVIGLVYNRPIQYVSNWCYSLSSEWQTAPADEVWLIDQTTNFYENLDNGTICRHYGHKHFNCPLPAMKMGLGFNLGLKLALGDYVMVTGIDWLFSRDFISRLSQTMRSDRIVSAMAGYLPQDYTLTWDWASMVHACEQGEISRRLSPGACQCVSTDWARQVHGYDERFPAMDGVDDDFRSRAIKAGLESVWLEWSDVQAIHQWHPRSELKGVGSELFGDAPVVANPDGWGQYEHKSGR